jgi:hypothetical protein
MVRRPRRKMLSIWEFGADCGIWCFAQHTLASGRGYDLFARARTEGLWDTIHALIPSSLFFLVRGGYDDGARDSGGPGLVSDSSFVFFAAASKDTFIFGGPTPSRMMPQSIFFLLVLWNRTWVVHVRSIFAAVVLICDKKKRALFNHRYDSYLFLLLGHSLIFANLLSSLIFNFAQLGFSNFVAFRTLSEDFEPWEKILFLTWKSGVVVLVYRQLS